MEKGFDKKAFDKKAFSLQMNGHGALLCNSTLQQEEAEIAMACAVFMQLKEKLAAIYPSIAIYSLKYCSEGHKIEFCYYEKKRRGIGPMDYVEKEYPSLAKLLEEFPGTLPAD